jgi:tetratricopeptide (TPR) repeat protein
MKLVLALVFVLVLGGCRSATPAEKLDRRGLARKGSPKAVDDFTQAIELEPTRADFWLHRGDERFRQKDWDGAIADYTESLRLEASGKAHLHRAYARRHTHLFDLALVDLEAAVELDKSLEDQAKKERTRIRAAMGDQPVDDEDD